MSDVTESTQVAKHSAFIRQCQADYKSAEITAVAHTAPGTKSFTNLLAVVELLHPGLEQNPLLSVSPKYGGYPRSVDLGKRAGKLYVQRWALTVTEALNWYRGCLAGSMEVPGTSTPTIVQLPAFDEDPPWPHLVVETHDFWDESPFWGERPGGTRWHRLVPAAPLEITEQWNASELEKARSWLLKQVHVDLLSRSVIAGSCHLLLPNPVYRRLTSTRVNDAWRAIEFHLSPYPGADVSTLELTHWNRRAWGATSIVRMPLRAGKTVVDLPEGVEEVAHAVSCAKRGLLEQSESAGFLTSIQVGFRFSTEQRTVVVPRRSARAPAETYSVGVAGEVEQMQIGEPRRGHALRRLAEDASQRRAAEQWGQLRIQWFDGDATAGRQAVRDIVRAATKNIDLLDPYFSGNDLLSFAIATSVQSLPVRILTSAEMCSKSDNESDLEHGEALLATLQNVRARDPRLSLEVRVMVGGKSPVHDRFLISDEAVWVLGASLNEFGDRGTLLLRLPRPPVHGEGGSPVTSISRDVFEAWWARGDELCPLLEDWVRRRSARSRQTFFGRVKRSATVLKDAGRRLRGVWRA